MKMEPNETNSQILKRIARYENETRGWAHPIRAGDFSYVVMKQFPDIKSARNAAKSQCDGLLSYKSPFSKPSEQGNHI
jgi:hypothetical protein